jgi:hypothetical protein
LTERHRFIDRPQKYIAGRGMYGTVVTASAEHHGFCVPVRWQIELEPDVECRRIDRTNHCQNLAVLADHGWSASRGADELGCRHEAAAGWKADACGRDVDAAELGTR